MADMKGEQSQRNERQTMLARNVSMSPEQWALVDEIDQFHALNNTSAALRMIVETYRRLRGEPANATVVGTTSAQ
jgi:sulfur relay (sulfurtransferase) DsrC/TusE family protein